MTGTHCRTWLKGSLVLVAAILAEPAAATPWDSYGPRQVVIISVDGLRADVINESLTPSIFAMGKRGAYSVSAQTSTIPQTLPNHASMLTGVTPSLHKVTWDEYTPSKGIIRVPTVLSAAKEAALHTVMVVGKEKLRHLAAFGTIVDLLGHDDQILNQATVRASSPFDLMFVHLPDVDLNGHAHGWMSREYLTQVSATDRLVGRFVASLPSTAVVILTADHGGLGRDHAVICKEDTTVPWIIAGPGIVQGRAIQAPVNTVDTAATVALVLGLYLPPGITGKPVMEAISQKPAVPDVVPSDLPY